MRIELTPEQQRFRDEVRAFVAREVAPLATETDRTGNFPKAQLEAAAAAGYLGPLIPREYGGMGLDHVAEVILIEEVSYACASTGFLLSADTTTATLPILDYGTPEQKQAYLPVIARNIACVAITEPGAGSDVAAQTTTATLDGDHWVLNGHKRFGTSGARAKVFTITAVTDPEKGPKGISAFIAEAGWPGIRIGRREDTMGLRGAEVVDLHLEGLRIPRKNLLGDRGAGMRICLSSIDCGRISISAQALGIARAALDLAITHAMRRNAFGKPIAEHQAIQFALADMATEIEAARLLVYRAATVADSGVRYSKEAAMAKLTASQTAKRCADRSLQIHGGSGYTKESVIERLYRDCRVSELYEGTSEIMRMVVARAVTGL